MDAPFGIYFWGESGVSQKCGCIKDMVELRVIMVN